MIVTIETSLLAINWPLQYKQNGHRSKVLWWSLQSTAALTEGYWLMESTDVKGQCPFTGAQKRRKVKETNRQRTIKSWSLLASILRPGYQRLVNTLSNCFSPHIVLSAAKSAESVFSRWCVWPLYGVLIHWGLGQLMRGFVDSFIKRWRLLCDDFCVNFRAAWP